MAFDYPITNSYSTYSMQQASFQQSFMPPLPMFGGMPSTSPTVNYGGPTYNIIGSPTYNMMPPPPMEYGAPGGYGVSMGYGSPMPYGPPGGYGAPGGYGMPYPQQDPNASLIPMIGQFFSMMMSTLMTGVGLGSQPGTQPDDGCHNVPDTDPDPDPDPTDDPNNDDPNEGLDTNKNSDILQIVADNVDDIPHKNGKITEKDLKDYLKDNPDLPDSTQEAIQNLVDNPELYNLLCLKSDSTPDKGFSTDVLDDSTDWDNLDIDDLDTVDDDKVWETLRNVNDNLKNIDGDASNGVTLDDIKKVALGQVNDPKLQDPEVQAAALKFMFDDELKQKFDAQMGGTGDGQGQVYGDPHFVGDDGETYDVMGEAGKTYNILSDKGIEYNATFQTYGTDGATTIGQAGIQINQHKVQMDAHADAPTVDGQTMEKDKPVDLGHGSTAVWDGTNLKITTPEYDITIKKNHDDNGDFLDQDLKAKNPYSDGVDPHGLWGQTVDRDKDQKNTGEDKGKQGGTVIDGTYQDYEVTDLWAYNDKYNRFDPNATTNTDGDGRGDGF